MLRQSPKLFKPPESEQHIIRGNFKSSVNEKIIVIYLWGMMTIYIWIQKRHGEGRHIFGVSNIEGSQLAPPRSGLHFSSRHCGKEKPLWFYVHSASGDTGWIWMCSWRQNVGHSSPALLHCFGFWTQFCCLILASKEPTTLSVAALAVHGPFL